MPFVPKVPDSCKHLDLALVERVLAKHHAYFPTAARELGVLPADLKRLTWAKPHLLDEAHEEMGVVVALAWGEIIKAIDSPDPRRRMWAADKIMSSWLARDHPFAPAGRGMSASVSEFPTVTFRWGKSDAGEPATESFERDGKTFTVPKYSDGSDDDPVEGELPTPRELIEHEAPALEPPAAEPTPEPPQLPKWLRPGGPPP